jgi:LysM domain/Transglycosylase SLT domain
MRSVVLSHGRHSAARITRRKHAAAAAAALSVPPAALVLSQAAIAPAAAAPMAPGVPGILQAAQHHAERPYTVRAGDTLSSVAARVYGHPGSWQALWWINRRDVPDPDLIHAGQKLRLSWWHPDPPAWLAAAADKAIARYSPAPAAGAPQASPPQAGAPAPPAATGGEYSFGELEALWVSAGGPASAEWDAATIAECESGGDADAYNPSGASGLWQILGQDVGGDIFSPQVNALNAVAKYENAGDSFSPWVCQP